MFYYYAFAKLPFVSFKQAFFLFIFALQFHSKDIYFHENTVREMCIYLTNRLIKILQILQLVLNLIFFAIFAGLKVSQEDATLGQ